MKYVRRTLSRTLAFCLALFVPLVSYAAPLDNPLKFDSIAQFIAGALKVMVMIALPIITLFLVVSGFKFISAQGNEQKLNDAKKNFVYVVLGALLILGAWIIATLIAGTVSQLTA